MGAAVGRGRAPPTTPSTTIGKRHLWMGSGEAEVAAAHHPKQTQPNSQETGSRTTKYLLTRSSEAQPRHPAAAQPHTEYLYNGKGVRRGSSRA